MLPIPFTAIWNPEMIDRKNASLYIIYEDLYMKMNRTRVCPFSGIWPNHTQTAESYRNDQIVYKRPNHI